MCTRKQLRVHHLLCLPLFVGEGYSDGFSANMAKIKAWLMEHGDEPLVPVAAPDMICRGCPHLTAEQTCACQDNHVREKDEELARRLDIAVGKSSAYRELLQAAKRGMTREYFERSCQNCEWYRRGLCSYEKWSAAVKNFLTDFAENA